MEIYINENNEEYNSFIYQWIDIKLNKLYIGSHYGSVDDGYLFGGIDIKKEYKNRPSDFKREILSYQLVSEYSEIRKIEKEYLIKYDVENNDIFYNRTNESYGGYHKKSVEKRLLDIDENGLNHFQRAAIKMVKTRISNDSYKTSKEKEYKTKFLNVDKYNNTKLKISNTLKGSRWVNKDGYTKYVNEDEYIKYIDDDWFDVILAMKTYEECKLIAIENNITSAIKWKLFSKTNKDVPYNPDRRFKDIWINWNVFLNKN
jgi:hypothetical protein